MSNFLSDAWEASGDDFDTFKKELNKMEEQTKVELINMDDVYFLSVSDMGTGYTAIPLNANSIWKKTKCSLSLKRFDVDRDIYVKKGFDEETINEAFDNGLFLTSTTKKVGPAKIKKMMANGEYIPVSEKAMSTISSRINHYGYGFLSERLVRDLSIVKKFDKPVPISLVCREDPETGLKKVFAVMSEKYTTIPQSLILDVLERVIKEAKDDLGKAVCAGWSISHSNTRVYVEFPSAGKEFSETYHLPDEMLPGIMLETSDIGKCSLRIRGYFRMTESQTVSYMEDEYTQAHIGDIDTKEILNAAKNKIFPQYLTYPERLAMLMTHDVVDDTMAPLLKLKIMSKLYRSISKEIGLVKAIGKPREKNLINQLIEAINPEITYTAYDVIMTFLTLATCVETESKAVIESIAKTAPSVMKYKFEFEEEEDDLLVI